MVRFHVLYDQIIGLTGSCHGLNMIQPLMSKMSVHSIHYGYLFIHNHIRIIGHAVLDYILAFEEIYGMVVHTSVSDIVCNVHW